MVERRRGVVRPPVIEGVARSAQVPDGPTGPVAAGGSDLIGLPEQASPGPEAPVQPDTAMSGTSEVSSEIPQQQPTADVSGPSSESASSYAAPPDTGAYAGESSSDAAATEPTQTLPIMEPELSGQGADQGISAPSGDARSGREEQQPTGAWRERAGPERAKAEPIEPEQSTQGRSDPPAPPAAPPAPARRSSGFPVLLSAVLGALLGAGLVYGLAAADLLPGRAASPPLTTTADTSALEARIAALEAAPDTAGPDAPDFSEPLDALASRIAALEMAPASAETAAPDLSEIEQRLQQQIEQRLAALETAAPPVESGDGEAIAALQSQVAALQEAAAEPAETVDITPLQTELDALSQRLDALPEAATPEAVSSVAADVSGLRADLSALRTSLGDTTGRIAEANAALAELRGAFDAAQAEAAADPEPDPQVESARLAVALASAFATGEPYRRPLDQLRSLLPALETPPEPVVQRQDEGLMTHAELTASLSDAVPEMLAARPADPSAGPAEGAFDFLRTVLAVRPAGEIEGDTPYAVVSRLEAALARQDYRAAADLMASLPEPMREQAGELPEQLAARAAGETFLENVDAAVSAFATTEANP